MLCNAKYQVKYFACIYVNIYIYKNTINITYKKKNVSRVNKLWLRFCQLKDKGINNLLTVLDETNRKTQISLLHLDCNGITCEGAKKIAKVNCIRLIILLFNSFHFFKFENKLCRS